MSRTFLVLFLLFGAFQVQAQLLSDEDLEKYIQVVEEEQDSSVEAAYKLAIHYRVKGNAAEKLKRYCFYILEKTEEDPLNFRRLSTLRILGLFYFQNSMGDSMDYYVDQILSATENTKDSTALVFRGRSYNVKASTHLYLTNNYEKAYPLIRKSMEIAEEIENSDVYLSAAYSLCNLTYDSEPKNLPEMVDTILQKVSSFDTPPEGKYILNRVQKFKYLVLSQQERTTQERTEALQFYRQSIRTFQEDKFESEAIKDIVEMIRFFPDRLGKDSVLYFAGFAYDFYKKDKAHPDATRAYFHYAEALYNMGFYDKAIPVFEETIPMCGIDENSGGKLEGDYSLLAAVYEYLVYCHLKLDDLSNSQAYFQKYVHTTKDRQTQVVSNAVSELEVKYDTEKKEMENQALLSENDLIQTRFRLSVVFGLLLLSLLGTSIFFYLKTRRNEKELERINQSKNQLFEIVAHDLKGPVASFANLSFNVSHLIKNKKYERLLELAEYYEKAGRKINYILVNLLDWAISQKDHFVHSPQPLDVKSEVGKIIEGLNYSTSQKNVQIENRITGDVSMFFDKDAFKVIVRNLLHNAVKFSHQDSTVIVDYDEFGLKIKDSGIGMGQETIQKVLKKQRVESNFGTNAEKGNGIGLSTCIKLAEQNNAKLDIESRIGEGAVFTLAVLGMAKE